MKDTKFIAITSDNKEFLIGSELLNSSSFLQKMYHNNVKSDSVIKTTGGGFGGTWVGDSCVKLKLDINIFTLEFISKLIISHREVCFDELENLELVKLYDVIIGSNYLQLKILLEIVSAVFKKIARMSPEKFNQKYIKN